VRFNEGKALMAERKIGEACRKLEESARLDRLPGTVLNLAVCHEAEGRTASAVSEFQEARVLAQRDHRDDRVAFTDQHLRGLETKVSALIIVVGPGVDVPELSVTRDGEPVAREAWGKRVAVDPGDHVVEASAPHKNPWKTTVSVQGDGATQVVTLAPLGDVLPPPPAPPPVGVPGSTADPSVSTKSEGLPASRVIAIVSAGFGVAAVGVGSYAGVLAIQKHADPRATCTTTPCAESVSLNNQAKFAADASTVSFGIGILGLVAGAYLWLWPSHPPAHAAAIRFVPSCAPDGGSLGVAGAF
jgi:hypothetical protein